MSSPLSRRRLSSVAEISGICGIGAWFMSPPSGFSKERIPQLFYHPKLWIKGFAMKFEFYHPGLDDVPKLSVDGTVANSVHFSHWEGNETPAELRADTSTEIALNLVAS